MDWRCMMLSQQSARCFPFCTLWSQSNEPGTNKDHPEVHLLSPPATRPAFLHLWAGHLTKKTLSMVLLASRAAARACQCWRLLLQKPTHVEGYPQAISHNQSLGCWRPPTFMPTYRGVPNSSRLQTVEPLKYLHLISMLSTVLQAPPRGGHQALDSLITNWVVVEGKFFDRLVDAQRIGQDLEEMASRAWSGWLVAKKKRKDLLEGILEIGSEWSIWESCSRILQTLQKKKAL